jgi:ubiquinone/menaquinone biosynthesis C-methylase UbiE
MNRLEHCLCSSSLWRYLTGRHVLPWILSGACPGDHILEIGAGYGAATSHLHGRTARVTSLEYDANSIRQLKLKLPECEAVSGDGARLPFPAETFSCVMATLVVHHLQSRELQDRMFAEVFRVLRAGGVFLAFEIPDNWLNRVSHFRSTFTPVTPGSAFLRLDKAGFCRVSLDFRHGGFRINALRPY